MLRNSIKCVKISDKRNMLRKNVKCVTKGIDRFLGKAIGKFYHAIFFQKTGLALVCESDHVWYI